MAPLRDEIARLFWLATVKRSDDISCRRLILFLALVAALAEVVANGAYRRVYGLGRNSAQEPVAQLRRAGCIIDLRGGRHTRCSRTAWPDALRGAHSEGICSESPATRSRRGVYVYRSDVVHMVSDKVGHALAVRYATREKNGVYVAP